MTTAQSFTPWQLRELRSQMEDDFARVLRSATNREENQDENDAFSSDGAWNPARRSASVHLDAVLHGSAQDRLAAISAALRRLDTGTYGECARCGNAISFGRLSVMPEATMCIACGAV